MERWAWYQSPILNVVRPDLGLLYRMYGAFNARDADAVLAAMVPDVEWPNGREGGWLRGHEAVREYWVRQWGEIDPRVTPIGFMHLPDGRLRLDVRQSVHDYAGNSLSRGVVGHIYTFREGLVARMEIG